MGWLERWSASGGVWGVAQLRQNLQDAVQVCQARAETIDEFVEHELAIHQAFAMHLDFFSQILQELSLYAAERFGSRTAIHEPDRDWHPSTGPSSWARWR